MRDNDRYPNSSGRHSGGRGRGRFSGRFAKKNHNKNNNKGLYMDGIFQGRNKKYSVVRDSSEDQSDKMEELIKDTIAYGHERAALMKVANAVKLRVNKTDFIPTYPDKDEYSDELEVQAKDEDGSVLKDANGTIVLKMVRVVRDQSKKDELMGKYKREYDHGYKSKDQCEDGVSSTVHFMQGQIEEATWKRIERSSHPSSGKTFQEHAAAYEIVECIECMEQVCGVNGDEEYTWEPAEFFDKPTELSNLKQGDVTEEEYEREIKRQTKFLKGKGGSQFMGTYYLKYLLEEEGESLQTYGRLTKEEKLGWDNRSLDLYTTFIFIKGCKCRPPYSTMKKDLDKIYETHKTKETYPQELAKALELHRRKYKDDGRKNKKDRDKNDNNNHNTGGGNEPSNDDGTGEQEEDSGDNNNNNNNETSPTGDAVSAHLDDGLDEEFQESLLIAARNNNICFDMTEPDDYSLASYHSEESLAGAHFGGTVEGPADKESETTIKDTTVEPHATQQNILQNKNNHPDDIEFTILDSEDTQEDFRSGSN